MCLLAVLLELEVSLEGLEGVGLAVEMFADEVRLPEVNCQRLGVTVVEPLVLLLLADVALLVLLAEMVLELFVVEEVLVAKLAPGMQSHEVVLLVKLSFLQVGAKLVRGEGFVLVHQKDLVGDAEVAEEARMVPGEMLLVVLHVLEVLLAGTPLQRALEFVQEDEGSLGALVHVADAALELL